MRHGRKLAVMGIASSLAVAASPARAAESHFAGDDVKVTVDEAGVARVEHAIAYRIVGTPPKGFDVVGVEPEAAVDPVAPIALDGETAGPAHVERRSERVLHVAFDALPRNEKRLAIVVRVAYSVDLVRAGELTRDGAMWRLAWTAPSAPEGFDAARVVLDLPAAPTAPQALAPDGAPADARLVTARRGPDRDELEIARPHVARGEAGVWIARIDPRALPRAVDPTVRPLPAPPAETEADGSFAIGLAAVGALLLGMIASAKARTFDRACRARGLVGRGLVPFGRAWRVILAAVAFGAGLALEASDRPTYGALGVAIAAALLALRAPSARPSPRGPGQWLALAPAEAFGARDPSDLLDVATVAGRWTFALALAGALAVGVALRTLDATWAWLVPLDTAILLAALATGSRAQLPPDRARAPRRRLAALHRAFGRDRSLRVAPWARVPMGATTPDELRLLVVPRAPMPGVVGIEVGVAWVPTWAGYAPETEVLVRVRDDSAAAARMGALSPGRRSLPGRKPDERVLRLLPSLPSRAGALALVRRLASELRDRRKTLPAPSWTGLERRLPPNERLRRAA